MTITVRVKVPAQATAPVLPPCSVTEIPDPDTCVYVGCPAPEGELLTCPCGDVVCGDHAYRDHIYGCALYAAWVAA